MIQSNFKPILIKFQQGWAGSLGAGSCYHIPHLLAQDKKPQDIAVVKTKALCALVNQVKFVHATLTDAITKGNKFIEDHKDSWSFLYL